MIITKSLFVEYIKNPHVAWWRHHDKEVYERIREKKYGHMDGKRLGTQVEDLVERFIGTDNIVNVEDLPIGFKNRHQSYARTTAKVLQTNRYDVIREGGFLYNDLFVKCDFLKKNKYGKRDLIEVKSKTAPFVGNELQLQESLAADVGFQKYVIEKSLGEKLSGKYFLTYIQKEYVFSGGEIDRELVDIVDVSLTCFQSHQVERILKTMKEELALSKQGFDEIHPYTGGDYLSYFGKEPPADSLRSLVGIEQSFIQDCYNDDKLQLSQFTLTDIPKFLSTTGKKTRASIYLEHRLQGEIDEFVDEKVIGDFLADVEYPCLFYDYEFLAWPIPFIPGTSPWQQVVVQYSFLRIEENGKQTSYTAIWDGVVSSYKKFIGDMVDLMVELGSIQTYLLRGKSAEHQANQDLAHMFPEYETKFTYINSHGKDLMPLFRSGAYYHKDLYGSASIKDVAEVVTGESYKNLAIRSGGEAAKYLYEYLYGEENELLRLTLQQQLTEYSQMDVKVLSQIFLYLKRALKEE